MQQVSHLEATDCEPKAQASSPFLTGLAPWRKGPCKAPEFVKMMYLGIANIKTEGMLPVQSRSRHGMSELCLVSRAVRPVPSEIGFAG